MTPFPFCIAVVRLMLAVVVDGRALVRRRSRAMRSTIDAGMSTAEYAVGTVAAVGFAVVLYKVVRSAAVSSALSSLVTSALHAI